MHILGPKFSQPTRCLVDAALEGLGESLIVHSRVTFCLLEPAGILPGTQTTAP